MDLSGDRVRLRALRPDDAATIARLLADPEVTRGLGDWARLPFSEQHAADFIARSSAEVHWAIEAADDGAFIGVTGLHAIAERHRRCEWGIWTGPPDRWGRGYGTEACRLSVGFAFTELGMHKVCLAVFEGNDRARACYEKAGFSVEGVRRRQLWRGGRWFDETLMAVFADHPLYALPAAGR